MRNTRAEAPLPALLIALLVLILAAGILEKTEFGQPPADAEERRALAENTDAWKEYHRTPEEVAEDFLKTIRGE